VAAVDDVALARTIALALHGHPFVREVDAPRHQAGAAGMAFLTDADGERHLIMVLPDLPEPTRSLVHETTGKDLYSLLAGPAAGAADATAPGPGADDTGPGRAPGPTVYGIRGHRPMTLAEDELARRVAELPLPGPADWSRYVDPPAPDAAGPP
jgi:hypothetical protein